MPPSNGISGKESSEDLASPRRDLYTFLSSAFLRVPTEDLVATVTGGELLDDLESLFGAQVVERLRRVAEANISYKDIRQSYMDLFRIPRQGYVAPFESVFVAKGKTKGKVNMMGPEAMRAMQTYLKEGQAELARGGIIPDHIGVQLEFMRYLCQAELDASDHESRTKARATQRRFLEEHLAEWLPKLQAAVGENDPHGFYDGICQLAGRLVDHDLAMLGEAG